MDKILISSFGILSLRDLTLFLLSRILLVKLGILSTQEIANYILKVLAEANNY